MQPAEVQPQCIGYDAEVDSAEVSHEAGTAVVTLNSGVQDEVLKKTVEDQDYKVTSIQ